MLEFYLQKKLCEKFTGVIKLGIEHGMIVAMSKNNKVDIPITSETVPQELLIAAEKIDFYGTLVLEFLNGIVSGYAYTRTYKGDMLKKELM